MRLTTEQIRELLDAATPGPWVSFNRRDHCRVTKADEASDPDAIAIVHVQWRTNREANARLIAAAPDLAREVLRLREENERLERRWATVFILAAGGLRRENEAEDAQ